MKSGCMVIKAPAKNNLFLSNPGIAKEWHPMKNGSLTPKDIMVQSNRKVWWQCAKDHVWSATINERLHGNNCPYCSGKIVEDENIPQISQVTQAFDSSLADQWHPTKNEDLKVWWLCPNGHEWSATVLERNQGNNCPCCSEKIVGDEAILPESFPEQKDEIPKKVEEKHPSGGKVSPLNCLREVNPGLASQWHPTKNGSLTPSDVTATSSNKVWWLCSKGHEWQATVLSRNKGQGCFYCSYVQRGKYS